MTMRYTLLNGDADKNEFMAKFTFDAKNDDEAERRAFGWARYQGSLSRDVKVRKATRHEMKWSVHNDFVSRF